MTNIWQQFEIMYSAKEVSIWFLGETRKRVEIEDAEFLTNMKLQKLLYYAQGCFLGIYGTCLFSENIIAWKRGPVVEEVYNTYKHFLSKGIDEPEANYLTDINNKHAELLTEVYNVFGKYSAWKLHQMISDEKPWKETEYGNVINTELIKSHFLENYIAK